MKQLFLVLLGMKLPFSNVSYTIGIWEGVDFC